MNLTDAVDFEFSEQDMSKPLKNITLSEADSTETFKFKPFEYERGVATKTAKGIVNTIRDMQDLPEQVKIFGKRISFGFGGYFGDTPEETERKKLNLITAERNLNEEQAERYRFSSQKETESLAYGVGGGIVNYGTMLLPAGAVGGTLKAAGMTAKAVKGAEAAGLGTMGVMELAGQVQDKTPTTPEGDIDIEAMTPEWARKATGGTIAYTALSAVTEKYVGFGQQVRMWSKPIQWGGNITSKALTTLKTAGKNALSEGMTEGIQDLEATGISLLDGTLEMNKLPARLQQAWKSAIIGGIIGGGVGTAAAMKSARNVKKQLREMVAPVVGEQDAQQVAEAIFDAGTDDMTKAISIELELSSELKNKHGKVWNSMLAAVSKEMDGKPRFDGMTEDEKASYANTVAKHFADQLLVEANYRGETLDAILSASDITYDKGIRLKRHINLYDALKNPEMIPPETKLRKKGMNLIQFLRFHGGVIDEGGELKSRDAQKQYIGLINKNGMTLDDAALLAWQEGYLPSGEFNYGRPDVNALLDAIDEGLRGHHRYNVVDDTATFREALDDLEEQLNRMGIDWEKMTAPEIEKAVDDYIREQNEWPEIFSLWEEAEFYANNEPEIGMSEDEAEQFAIETEGKEYPIIDDKDLPFYYQLAEENAQLDAENPAYEGETINIDGQERTVYNSEGERIAQSEAALRNFYKWFGDSKVVDKQGRPLVVYHGTKSDFNIFDTKKAFDGAFYFSTNKSVAEEYSKDYSKGFNNASIGFVKAVYLSIKNPTNTIPFSLKAKQFMEQKGFDGVIYSGKDGEKIIAAFNPTQIKSTQNRGTYSESENIYYQFAGEKALTAALDDLDYAQQMEWDGQSRENILRDTGWFRGADGKWRFEISDKNATIKESGLQELNKGNSVRLEDILGHKDLYKAYPALANIEVKIDESLTGTSTGAYVNGASAEDMTIYVRRGEGEESFRKILLHEIQHDIQTIEGFARGGDISTVSNEFLEKRNEKIQSERDTFWENKAKELLGKEAKEYLSARKSAEIYSKKLSDTDEKLSKLKREHYWENNTKKREKLDERINKLEEKRREYNREYFSYAETLATKYEEIEDNIYNALKDETKKNPQRYKILDKYMGGLEGYRRLYGEIEARNTEARSDLTGRERLERTPESTQDVKNADAIVVFDDGTAMAYEPETYYQSAFAGSRVDYDRPSLEAIGSGEGNQAHGWGLYYALNKDVAEQYRKDFISEFETFTYHELDDMTLSQFIKEKGKKEAKKRLQEKINEAKIKIKAYQQDNDYPTAQIWQGKLDDLETMILAVETGAKGQVHEVDIPENPYLLDEQEMLIDQSDYVQEKIEQANKELDLGIEDSGITGDRIYQKISDKLGSDKAASQMLEKYGIKGITYYGKQDGRCFVIFNPADVKVIQKFYQRGKNPKGYTNITPDEYIIKLLEDADESTLPHEFAHYWLTEMWNYTRTGRASEKYMKRWQIISDYLGVKPEQTRLTRGQQEKFASSYEAYLTRGNLPTPLIGSVFDDYDKWLQRVYNDYNRINYQSRFGKRRVRLTDAAIKFFQSMTTGTLEPPALAPKDTGVKLETEPQLPTTSEVTSAVEAPTMYDTTRVVNITEGKKGVSKVFQREAMKHADRIVDELGVSYNKINLEEQAIKAAEWVQNNLEEARKVVNGAAAPEGIIDTAIFIAYENEMLRIGNNAEYQRALKIHSQVQTQRGQAIAAERISTDDVYNPAYWWKKLQKNKETQVAQQLFKGDVKALNEMIETETKSIMKQIAGKSKEEQTEALTKLAEKLKKDYNLDTLYQTPDEVNERTVQEFIKDTIGVNPDVMAGNEVINKAEQLQKLWENTKDKSGNPSVEAMRAKRELNNLIQAQTPSNTLAIWTSIFGRGVMLTSVKSPVLNIISNIEAGFTEGITRRLMYQSTEKAVDKTVKEEFSKYAWEVYKASADIVTTMNDYDDDMRIIGEQILHSQGQGRFRAASRVVEEVSFKYLMGAPDAVAKTFAFNDTADLLATKIAREEGAADISKRATEIYKDAILIKPETEQGQYVRKQAQQQAHYTTFTNDSWAAKFGLSARNWLNMVGKNKVRLGDLTMKFVKTPANVQMMGLEYGFGSLYTLYHVQDIINNPQSETSQIAIKAAVRNGLGIALAALLYSMLDPDDYFSEFDTLNPKEKDRMRAVGAMPNSIKIGNRWVSLDYFGQLGIPLVGMLEAKRNNGLRSYIQSGLTQAAKIPGIKETKQLIDSISEYARYDLKPEKIAQMMAGTVLDQARAMTIPAIVNDIAKMTDDYERDTMGGVMDKVISSIPGWRQTLPERYGIQGLVRTEPAASTLLFGSRVKTAQEDKLVREVEKLAKKGEQPSISDVTKYGDLRLLSPEKKVKVRKEFYKLYNTESKKLISTRDYQNKTADDKKKALNKVRNRVVKSLKEKYSNDIQREKRRR